MRLLKYSTFCTACAGLLFTLGCSAQNQDDRIQGKMFYRAPAKPPRQPNSMSVGRYGRNADYGRWTESGTGDSDMGYESSSSIGRYGTTAESAPWGYGTSYGGDPIDNAGVSSTYYDKGGSTSLGVSGDGASSSESREGGATYGTDAP